MAVLCASYPETCYAKYSSIPMKGDNSHEAVFDLINIFYFTYLRPLELFFRR